MKSITTVFTLGALAVGNAFGQSNGSGIVVLHPSASGALNMVGKSTVEVPARAVYVNSSAKDAVKTSGAATLDCPNLYVVGKAAFTGNSGCTGTVSENCIPADNPFATYHFPSTDGMTDHGYKDIQGGTVSLAPGYYSGGISISGGANVTLQPGTYVVGGNGFKLTSGSLNGASVAIHILSGSLDLAGNGNIELSPATAGGVVIAQAQSNTNAMKLAGGSNVLINGGIYAPNNTMRLTGTSDVVGEGPKMGDLVVANMLELAGTAVIRIGGPGMAAVNPGSAAVYD